MNDYFKMIADDIKKLWGNLDLNQKFVVCSLILVGIVASVFFIVKATEPNWEVLYSDLSQTDIAAISESLKKSGHPYKLSDDKKAILVKANEKEDLRIFVAENDLIQDSSPGFELLDDLQLGSTDFKNKLTKQRIFQGELTRSIEKINGITKARVQLAEPERSIFADNDEAPSASVVLILEPGYKLKASQVTAIKNLVAYSVPRLTNDKVFLTDQYGNVLSEDVSKNSTDMQTYRTSFEKEAAKKIKDTLETIMGKDNVSVQVSAQMDFNSTRSTIESYTPAQGSQNGVVLSQQGEKEIYKNPQVIQVPAPAQNANNQDPQNPQAPQTNAAQQNEQTTTAQTQNIATKTEGRNLSYEKEKNAVNYAVTKEVKQVVYAPGSVTRMTVAVAVNKILTDEEKTEIESLVQAAAGMDMNRGDMINVTSLKFTGIDNSQEEMEKELQQQEQTKDILNFIFTKVAPLLVVLILGLVAMSTFSSILKRPIAQKSTTNDEPVYGGQIDPYMLLQNEPILQQAQEFGEPDEMFNSIVDRKKAEISDTITSNPSDAARLLTSYIRE